MVQENQRYIEESFWIFNAIFKYYIKDWSNKGHLIRNAAYYTTRNINTFQFALDPRDCFNGSYVDIAISMIRRQLELNELLTIPLMDLKNAEKLILQLLNPTNGKNGLPKNTSLKNFNITYLPNGAKELRRGHIYELWQTRYFNERAFFNGIELSITDICNNIYSYSSEYLHPTKSLKKMPCHNSNDKEIAEFVYNFTGGKRIEKTFENKKFHTTPNVDREIFNLLSRDLYSFRNMLQITRNICEEILYL